MRMWGGRFAAETDPLAADFGRSIEVDRALALDDLAGSIAHVDGLARADLLTPDERSRLVAGLEALSEEVAAGGFAWDAGLEDVHLNLEAALAERIGPLAGKLHTGRSRNDQVALDLRLWLRRNLAVLDDSLRSLELSLVERAEQDGTAVMPGMTHVQPAQPVLLGHHLLAYVEMLERDRGRFGDAWRRADRSPLGAGALAGAGFAIDREQVADDLGLGGVTANSLDATSDRDFVVETLAAAALCMTHLSRLAEELVWWSTPAFGWLTLDDAWTTGSSMMPNKKNPDPAELIRGRAGRVIGLLTGLLATLKGLPLAYQRDLQETVEPLLDGVAVLDSSIRVMTGLLRSLTFRPERMRAAALDGYVTATSVADTLVERGIPFRDAHAIVGALVAEAERRGCTLDALPEDAFADLRDVPATPDELRQAATLEAALARPRVIGGTAPERVAAAIAAARARLDAEA
ncbi:MAG: argininosuccinate lyase [Candidatus Limnocylindrales bacterium]